jgi:CRP-like cAMP-binding protein
MDEIVFDAGIFAGTDCRSVAFADRGVVFIKDDPGDFAYFVASGKVEIRMGGRVIETIGPGGLFGEKALIDNWPRAASAVSVGPTELLVIDRDAFERLVDEVPGFAVNVMRLMARRLRAANAAAAPPVRADPLPPAVRSA